MESSFEACVGRQREGVDLLDPERAVALMAALGRPARLAAGDCLPPLLHWLYFWAVATPTRIGADGHEAPGDFLPAIGAARRMWAGGRVSFHQPLKLGEPARRTSTITAVSQKTGRSGPLTFVTLEHQLFGPDGLAITEQQDLVYREAGGASAAAPPAEPCADAGWSRTVAADPVLLFRYSALTMNSHRIHYDHPYATQQEGYRGLVVHGPLLATLMLTDAVDAVGAAPLEFGFRSRSPAFAGSGLEVCGRRDGATVTTWVEQAGVTAIEGFVRFGADR